LRRIAPFLLGLAIFFAPAGQAADPPWPRETLKAGDRLLAAAAPAQGPGEVLTIVIEGDGLSHDHRGRPTRDPTPRKPVGLEIARAWPSRPVAWLGRPCQYVLTADSRCQARDWTVARFSAEAVAATNAAIDTLKARAGARRVVLAGWSGGGTMAVLAAQARTDVAGIVTFASPLDLAAWTGRHRISPLTGSLDPAKASFAAPIAQVHLFGSLDGNVPPAVMRGAAERLSGGRGIVVVRPERHDCCWPRRAAEAQKLLESLRR